jgi:tRNA threonylcarbamoyladenosine biosynthesis protein TsaB
LRVLSVDTCTPKGSAALLEGRKVVAELRIDSLETHSARLLGSVDFLLASVGWRLSDLQLIAAAIGPGSFTGIRIGSATAMGLAQALAIPLAGISCLDATVRLAPGVEGRIGVIADAQRHQVYYAEYFGKDGRLRRTGKPLLLSPSDLKIRAGRTRCSLVVDAAALQAIGLSFPENRRPRIVVVDSFLAAAVGRLALERKRCWRSGEYLQTEPLYIRPPDARRQKAWQR